MSKSCADKRRFISEQDAMSCLKNHLEKRHGHKSKRTAIRAYKCPQCDGWHLTKRQPIEELREELRQLRKKISALELENEILKLNKDRN